MKEIVGRGVLSRVVKYTLKGDDGDYTGYATEYHFDDHSHTGEWLTRTYHKDYKSAVAELEEWYWESWTDYEPWERGQ